MNRSISGETSGQIMRDGAVETVADFGGVAALVLGNAVVDIGGK